MLGRLGPRGRQAIEARLERLGLQGRQALKGLRALPALQEPTQLFRAPLGRQALREIQGLQGQQGLHQQSQGPQARQGLLVILGQPERIQMFRAQRGQLVILD